MGIQERTITESGIKDVLLIGNGPAALAREVGEQIDNFDGLVVRFNHYTTKGYEKSVGSRTDYWIVCQKFPPLLNEKHIKRFYSSWSFDKVADNEVESIKAERIPRDSMIRAVEISGVNHPSTGLIATNFFQEQDFQVWIYGFDFLTTQRKHHYNNDPIKRGPWHDEFGEWTYFHKLHEQGKVKWFGFNPETESRPLVRQPVACGTDKDISWYRTAAHNAWYEWFGSLSKGKSILDVGAGMCEGMKILDKYSPDVRGIDIDERLLKLDPRLTLKTLDEMLDNSVDVIVCIDVIEHVIEDVKLINNMKRIARDAIFVTTPCYARSRCGNIAHCREYTIPQFMNFFKPTEIWSASPDGKVHLTKVLSRKENVIRNHSGEGPDNKKESKFMYHTNYVPIETKFNNTVDGEEWAHIAACFLKNGL